MPPYTPFLVYGTVTDSISLVSVSAVVSITTSVGSKDYVTNSSGMYVADIAEIGYVSGEIITISTVDKFNNEVSSDSVVVSGGSYNLNISLSVRDVAQ